MEELTATTPTELRAVSALLHDAIYVGPPEFDLRSGTVRVEFAQEGGGRPGLPQRKLIRSGRLRTEYLVPFLKGGARGPVRHGPS